MRTERSTARQASVYQAELPAPKTCIPQTHLQLHTHLSKRRLQQLIRTRIKHGNTIPLQYPRNCSNVKVRRLKAGIQPLRFQRKRNSCTRLRTESKGSGHSLLQTILEEI